MALLDLNAFKALNDSDGHAAGDTLLRACASAWQSRLRSQDLLGRLGGDESGILLPGCTADLARAISERLRDAVPHPAGCAIGISTHTLGQTRTQLLAAAEAELYADKSKSHTDRIRDPARIRAAHRAGFTDPTENPALQDLTASLRSLLEVPIAFVTLLSSEHLRVAAHNGLPAPFGPETVVPIDGTLCRHPVSTHRPLIILDARAHRLTADHPIVPDLNAVAYATAPIIDSDGYAIGAICGIDHRTRTWTHEEIATL